MNSDRGDEIRKRIIEERGAFAHDLELLGTQVRMKTDWRHYVERYPWLFVGAGFVIGYWLAPGSGGIARKPGSTSLGTGGGSAAAPYKSVLGSVIGAVVPLLTRTAINRVLAHFTSVEGEAENGGAESAGNRRRQPR